MNHRKFIDQFPRLNKYACQITNLADVLNEVPNRKGRAAVDANYQMINKWRSRGIPDHWMPYVRAVVKKYKIPLEE